MGGEKTRPKRVSIMRGFWYTFALPAQSDGAKFCKAFVVIEAVLLALDVPFPGAGVSYLSRTHLADLMDALGDLTVWYLALWFVRQRDEARAAAPITSRSQVARH